MNRPTYAALSHLSLYATLAGTDSTGRYRELIASADHTHAQTAALCIDQPGAVARVDQLLHQITGLQQGARRLRDALVRESADTSAEVA